MLSHKDKIQAFAGPDDPLEPFVSPTLFGKAVNISRVPLSQFSGWSKATIGGVILIDDAFYGMTIAHAFIERVEQESSRKLDESGDSDTDSTLSDSSDLEESASKDQSNIMPDVVSSDSDLDAIMAVYASGADENESSVPGPFGSLSSEALFVGFVSPVGNQEDSPDKDDTLSTPRCFSIQDDWALVKIHDPRFWSDNQAHDFDGRLIKCHEFSNDEIQGKVLLASARYGLISCHSNGTKTGLFSSSSKILHDTYQADVIISKTTYEIARCSADAYT